MTETTYSENDLRDALTRRSLDGGAEPDVTDFRARLGLLIAGSTGSDESTDDAPVAYLTPMATEPETVEASPETATGDDTVFELIPRTERDARRGSRRRLGYVIAAAAACVALGAAGIAVLHGSGTDNGAPAAHLPKQLQATQLPGSRFVGQYTGTGSSTIHLPAVAVPKNFEWSVYLSCTGKAPSFSIGQQTLLGDKHEANGLCQPGSYPGTSVRPVRGSVAVKVAAGVRWHLWFVLTPQLGTNAGVAPVSQGPLVGARRGTANYTTGTGNGVLHVHLPAGTSPFVQVTFACTGTGATLSGFTPDNYTSAYTSTCCRGFNYQWSISNNRSKDFTVQVHATKGTTWRVIVG